MGTRDEPRPSSALPLPVPLPPATLCDAAFPPYPTPFAREGRNFLRDPSGKAHLLRNASSCRVGARICVCIFRGGGTAGDLLPRGAEHASSRAAQRGRGVVRGCSLPPSFSSSLLPLPQGRDGGRSADGRTERAAGAPPGCGQAEREEQEVGDPRRVRGSLGRLSSSLGGSGDFAGSWKHAARTAEPRGGGPGGAVLPPPPGVTAGSERSVPVPLVTPRPGKRGLGASPHRGWVLGESGGGGCARTWGAGNGVCRRDGDKDNGICFGNGAKIMGFALGMVTKIRCRLPADRAGEALCRLLRFGRAAA